MLPEGLKALAAYRQFVLYSLTRRQDGKVDKIPHSPRSFEACNAHDPAEWVSYEECEPLAQALGAGWGVAFVLTDNDPFFCLDLDHVRVGDGWGELAAGAADMLPGCCIEISQSGDSLHLWGSSSPQAHRTRPNPDSDCPWMGHAELYSRRRFIALTGNVIGGDASTWCNLDPLIGAWFQPQANEARGDQEWREEPVEAWRGPTDNEELLRRAIRSESAASVWGAGVSFADLWTADTEALARRWPADGGYDESAADAALAAHLAFWTGCHHQRVLELMRESALVRPKWEREDYLIRTICLACAKGKDVLQDAPVIRPSEAPSLLPAPPSQGPFPAEPPSSREDAAALAPLSPEGKPISQLRTGRMILSAAEQQELFEGCVYVRHSNQVYVPGVAYTLDRARFDINFGGFNFTTADGKMLKSAWEAFTQSSVVKFPSVDMEGFSPTRAPGVCYVESDGQWAVNLYDPSFPPSLEGDVSLWWKHMENLFPAKDDRDIFMSWVCATVRYPGRKWSWAPLLVSGEGTGKTVVFDAIRDTLGRRFTRSTRGVSLMNRFNDWIGRHLLCVVEDFRLAKSSDRDELKEALKELVGGGRDIESEAKGKSSTNVANLCNFLFSCNTLDALRIDGGARRFAPLVIGLWTKEELELRGMNSNYFRLLIEWMRSKAGISALRHLFLTWPIPDHLNPATHCVRAPQTTTGDEMFSANVDASQQYIEEAIAGGLVGFRGGWATAEAVKAVLAQERMNIAPRSLVRLLDRIGYVPHPGLAAGWTDNPIPPNNRRTRLFIHRSVLSSGKHDGVGKATIVKMYLGDQDAPMDFTPMFGSEIPQVMR